MYEKHIHANEVTKDGKKIPKSKKKTNFENLFDKLKLLSINTYV